MSDDDFQIGQRMTHEEVQRLRQQHERRDATSVEEQCTATYSRSLDGGLLCCRFVAGHPGKHRTCYEGAGATEWDERDTPRAKDPR
jgi:hypothetical protein